jgi:hypothetical protein
VVCNNKEARKRLARRHSRDGPWNEWQTHTHVVCVLLCVIKPILGNRHVQSWGFIVKYGTNCTTRGFIILPGLHRQVWDQLYYHFGPFWDWDLAPKCVCVPNFTRHLRWDWVFLERTRMLIGIQFTTHLIEFFVVETKRFVGSFVNVILTRRTCGQRSSRAAESKRRALGNYFSERICYMFLISKCRGD